MVDDAMRKMVIDKEMALLKWIKADIYDFETDKNVSSPNITLIIVNKIIR